MISEICYAFENYYDKNNLTIKLPHTLSQMVNQDASIELVASNTLQPMNMILSHNIVTQSIAYIFVNTECNGVMYPNAQKKGVISVDMFKAVLDFQTVRCFTNLSKDEIVEKLDELKQIAVEFE